MSADETRPTPIRAEPRVAVIGCGTWGMNLIRALSAFDALAAVVDRNQVRAQRASVGASVPARTFDAVLRDPSIDALVIATPAPTHAEVALASIEAGKHVFVEKPLAMELADAWKVAKAAARNRRIVMVGHLLRYHRAYLELKSLVRRGVLGPIRHLDSIRLNFGRFRTSEDSLWSFAPHDVSMILDLIGSEPEAVYAVGSSFLQPNIADVTTTHLRFPDGESAQICVSWLHPTKEQRLTVVGRDAMAVFDDGGPWSKKLTVYRHAVDWAHGHPTPIRAEPAAMPLEPSEPLADECRHFLDSLAEGRRPATDEYEGIRVLRVLHTARESMRTSIAERVHVPLGA